MKTRRIGSPPPPGTGPRRSRGGRAEGEGRLARGGDPAADRRPRFTRCDLLISCVLAIGVIAVFGQTVGFEFLAYDDPVYVRENPQVLAGVSGEGAAWAFRSGDASNWHPLTWLSLMLDARILGRGPEGFHLVNLLLHLAATLVLYRVLERMTLAVWPSAFAAALFALHPAHVESVAWISERKDVLSALLGFLTLGAYARYAARPGLRRYTAVFALLALGLMAKPMLVTLPFVLLLLDFWPLRRLGGWMATGAASAPDRRDETVATPDPRVPVHAASAHGDGAPGEPPRGIRRGALGRLAGEKIPLLGLAAASSVVTYLVQQRGGAMLPLERLPLEWRFANAGLSYWRYIGKLCWPVHLLAYYRFEVDWSTWQVALACLALMIVSALALWKARSLPYLAVGWFWYVGTLVPVIGLVQVGRQALADRYTYIPYVGLFIVIAWGAKDLASAARVPRPLLAGAAAVTLLALGARAFDQTRLWRSTTTLFEHVLAEDPRNAMAHNMVGFVLADEGKADEAERHFREALAIEPSFLKARLNLGLALARRGEAAEAERHLEQALRAKPDNARAQKALGEILIKRGHPEEAGGHFAEAVRLDPGDPQARYFLGLTLAARGRYEEAAASYNEALRLKSDEAHVWNSLGVALQKQKRPQDAMKAYTEALRIKPDSADARYNLGLVLDVQGRTDAAIAQFREVLRLHPDYKDAEAALASALARRGAGGSPSP